MELNEVAHVNLYLDQPVAFEKYADSRDLGAFILIDRQTNGTVAAGTLDFALRRAGNIHWQHLEVDKSARALIKHQAPRCVWFTGLSGSGKSTRSEEHTSELQSLMRTSYAVFCLKKRNKKPPCVYKQQHHHIQAQSDNLTNTQKDTSQ